MRALDRVIAVAIVGFVLAVYGSPRASEDAGVASPVDRGTRAAAPSAAPARLLAADVRALSFALPAAAPVAIDETRAKRRAAASRAETGGFGRTPRVIGFGRELPAEAQILPLETLPWMATADGGRAARIEIASPGAVAIRLGLRMNQSHPNLVLRFRGSGVEAETFGPVPARAIAGATSRHGLYWSPVLAGEQATVELRTFPGADLAGTVLTLTKLSHLVEDGIPRRSTAKAIGQAGACGVDVACQPSTPALTEIANAVGRIVFTNDDGITMVCTGTLLNDSIASRTPYFLTANHCVDSAGAAATINVYWFYRAQACGAREEPPYVQQTGGATLLARSEDWDWSLVRFHETPPAGVHFAAWRAERIPVSTSVISVHHPAGDLAKFGLGTTTGYRTFNDGSSFVMVYWSEGATEGGSSGAGLFTHSAAYDTYELRGTLWAGDVLFCRNPGGVDYFTRLDIMLPLMRSHLTPDSVDASGRVVAVEFYNARLDHYFITTDADEVDRLDTGQTAGWVRTGFRFLAYDRPTAGASPVCRFYLRPEVGDSHFYSADPAECAATARRFGADWIEESASVFYIPLPDTRTGACPAGTRPLWRFYHADAVNHRYTAEVAVRNQLRRARGWIAEGYGPDGVIMCSPDGS